MITVDSVFSHGHTSTWHNQNMCQKMPLGNLLLSNTIRVSGNNPSQIISLFNALNCPIFCDRTCANLQTNYLIPSVYRLWDLHQADNITAAQRSMFILGGDGRCDSPGHSAKYCSYNVIDLETNIILDLQLVQSNEIKNKFHMELEGLKRGLDNLKEYGLTVSTLLTDHLIQVKNYMKEEHKNKSVSKKLEMAAKKTTYREIRPLIKSIVNHIFGVASSSASNSQLKHAKRLSIINHVSDIHEGHSWEFPKYYIQELKEAVMTRRASLPTYEQALGDVPDNLTENYAKVDKDSLVEKHKSRFPFKPMYTVFIPE